jgi:Ca2+-binding EF-hand superfamily protein
MIGKEDVLQVAKSLKQELTEAEVQEVINRYPFEQDDDPGGTWNLVVEKIMYDLIEERE